MITGNGALTKVGYGKATLSNASTFSGGVAVNGGTLQIDGSLSQFGVVSVNSGGTLAGNGSTGTRFVDVNAGGTLSPGTSAGRLNTDDVEFAFRRQIQGRTRRNLRVPPTTSST